MKNSKYDVAITFSAIFISICAFFVSIYQANVLKEQTSLMREQQHASVWPRLFIGKSTGPGISKILLRNDGVGPALIKHVEVTVDGKIMISWNGVLTALTNKSIFRINKTNISNRVIRPGDELTLLNILDEGLADYINNNSQRITIAIYYSSIYERGWLLNQDFGKQGFATPIQIELSPFTKDNKFLD